MELSGQERKNLHEALRDAFPKKSSLEQMLSFELNKKLNEIVEEGSLKDIIFKLITTAEAEGWVQNLVHAASASNPGNIKLVNVAEELLSLTSDLKTIIKRILSKSYTQYDIGHLCELVLKTDEFVNLRELLFLHNSDNALQLGNVTDTSSYRIGRDTYSKESIQQIRDITRQYSQQFLSEDFQEISSVDFQGDYSQQDFIEYRHLTGVNEYPTLSFLEDELPQKLMTILGINNTPIIYRGNSILSSLERFANESNNKYLLTYKFVGANITYSINNNNLTRRGTQSSHFDGSEGINKSVYNTSKEVFTQSQENFEKHTLDYAREDKNFEFAPVSANFENIEEEAVWTSILEDEYSQNYGTILHYPKLSKIHLTRRADTWIKNIIKINPHVRGFILFSYLYIQSLEQQFGMCSFNLESLVSCIPPNPYIRFVDIKNIQNKAIKIESISFNIIEKNDYELTNLTDRTQLLSNGKKVTQKINILLNPQNHLLIPIEFGFDTESHAKMFKYYSQQMPENLASFISKKLYVAKMPDDNSDFNNIVEDLDSRNINISDIYYSSPEQINQLICDEVQFSEKFAAEIKTPEDLFTSIPRRFAVGSFMDVTSLKINGQDIKIDTPSDIPLFSMSVYFAYGSCPYLLIYNFKKGYWIDCGTILYGKEDKKLEGTEVYNLGRDISKIKIEERDKEVTYIKSLSIIFTEENTNKIQEIYPQSIQRIIKAQGCLILKQRQFIVIDLENILPENAVDIKLKISGYYEITQ